MRASLVVGVMVVGVTLGLGLAVAPPAFALRSYLPPPETAPTPAEPVPPPPPPGGVPAQGTGTGTSGGSAAGIVGPRHVAISVRTDKGIYKDGEPVKISGKVLNVSTAALLSTVVSIEVRGHRANPQGSETNEVVYQQLLEPKDNEFADAGYVVQFPNGDQASDLWRPKRIEFDVEAHVFLRQAEGQTNAAAATTTAEVQRAGTTFSAEQPSLLNLLLVILVPSGSIVALLILASWAFVRADDKKDVRWTIILIYAICVLGLVIAFVAPLLVSASPATEALLRTTPVGIARGALGDGGDVEWLMNLGGTLDADNVLRGGYGVPMFVLVLAMVGGVLATLLKLASFLFAYDAIVPNSDDEKDRLATLRANLMHEFISVVSAPFLGIVAFSLAGLADYKNRFALSVIAFAVGFVSDQIVQTIRGLAGKMLSAVGDKPAEQPPAAPEAGDAPPAEPSREETRPAA